MDGQEGSPVVSPLLDGGGAHRQSPQLEVVVEEGQGVSTDMSSTVTPDTVVSAPDTSMNIEGVPIESPEASAAATLASVANSGANSAAQAAVPSPVPAIPNPLPPGYNKDQPICANCSTQTTPLWRRSHDSTHILCNACALFFKMKGRPRPISLKTDVIKSRNRSKGKSTSKDRGGAGALVGGTPKKHDRGESTSRSREEGKVGQKSAPGGADVEEDDLEDGRSSNFGDGFSDADTVGRKARKMAPAGPYGMPIPGYGGHFPYPYPYPHPHPHAHQPYPPRARSRSSSSSRRATSRDARPPSLSRKEGAPGSGNSPNPQNGNPYSAYPPPPPGYHPGQPGLHADGYYPYYGYPGYPPPGQPYYPPGGPAYAQAQAQAHALSRQAPAITHAQSDSRSKSETDSPRSSASPPNAAAPQPPNPSNLASYYPHPNPNYPHQPPHQYSHSPLSSTSNVAPKADDSKESSDRVTLAPMQPGGGTPRSLTPGADVHLPSIGSVANGGSAAPPSPTSHVPRHTALFSARYASADDKATASKLSPDDRIRRRTSVSSNSASVSDSSDGVRSPETNGRVALPWAAPWAPEDERRGRSPHRYEDLAAAASLAAVKGKGREFEEVDELDEDDAEQGSRMVGVEAGLGELRVVDSHSHHPNAPTVKTSSSSRSRSSGHGGPEERGRPRSAYARGRSQSQSTSRARAGEMRSSSAASSGRAAAQEAEIARLKNKVAELTFLNGLMQSRLGQLEAPGRVPNRTVTSMTAATPRPYPDMMEEEDEEEAPEEEEVNDELDKYGVKAQDPAVRASLLQFFRQQGGHATSH